MILHIPESRINLKSYGIGVPLLDDRVERTLQSLKGKKVLEEQIEPLSESDVAKVHDKDFVRRLFSDSFHECIQTTYELESIPPESATWGYLRESLLMQAAGTRHAADLAFQHGSCFFFGGGMHHAMTFTGRGFCLVNDLVITANHVLEQGKASHVWIVDVDAHKGDGSAQMTANDDRISTLSIHMGDGWPFNSDDPTPWQTPSTIDVEMLSGEECEYMKRLQHGIEKLEDNGPDPGFAIVVMGADPYEHDELASTSTMKLTLDQLWQRDDFIHRWFTSRNIPVIYTMAGGYGARSCEVYSQFLNEIY